MLIKYVPGLYIKKKKLRLFQPQFLALLRKRQDLLRLSWPVPYFSAAISNGINEDKSLQDAVLHNDIITDILVYKWVNR